MVSKPYTFVYIYIYNYIYIYIQVNDNLRDTSILPTKKKKNIIPSIKTIQRYLYALTFPLPGY